MFRLGALASLLVGLAFTSTAAAQVNLHWKLKEGDTFFVEEKIGSKTAVTVSGTKSTEEQMQHRLSRFVVKNRTRDDIVLEQRIEWWKSKIVGGLAGDQDDTKLMEQLSKDIVFTIHLSPRGAITRFEGYDQFLKRLAAIDAAEAKKLGSVAGEDVLRAPLVQIFDILPADAVKKGQTWDHDSVVPMGPLGTFKLLTTFNYLGLRDGGEQIGTKASFSFSPRQADSADLGFKIQKLELTKKEATGEVVFDNIKGRLLRREMTLPLAGTMVIELMGTPIEVQLEGTETRTIRMTDKRPVP
jgi:hypothetical protein